MFTQFKNYVRETSTAICVAAGTGALSGMASGLVVLSTGNFNDSILSSCAPNDINTMLRAQMIGGITGLAVGAVAGFTIPTIHMFFDWYDNRRERSSREFQQIDNSLHNVEMASVRP